MEIVSHNQELNIFVVQNDVKSNLKSFLFVITLLHMCD